MYYIILIDPTDTIIFTNAHLRNRQMSTHGGTARLSRLL